MNMLSLLFRKIKVLYLGSVSLLIGMKVTIRNYFAPAVTLNYPLRKGTMTANYRGMVDLKPEACVICYQCIKICPAAAIDLAHKQVVVQDKKKNGITKFTYNAELCCFCGLCDEICPTDAIFMNKLYEVSAFSHDPILNIDLMKADKYEHLVPGYSWADEVKQNALNTIGKVVKSDRPPAAVNNPVPAGAASTSAGK